MLVYMFLFFYLHSPFQVVILFFDNSLHFYSMAFPSLPVGVAVSVEVLSALLKRDPFPCTGYAGSLALF